MLKILLIKLQLAPLPDLEGQHEATAIRQQFTGGAHDINIGKTVLQIELAQFLGIKRKPVGIVFVIGAKGDVPFRLTGSDHILERTVTEGTIADEFNRRDFNQRAFINFKDEVNPAIRQLDNLGFNHRGITAELAIDFHQQRLGIKGDLFGEHTAGFDIDEFKQLLIGEHVIALNRNAVDDGVFQHLDDDHRTVKPDGHILKQIGGKQSANGTVQAAAGNRITRRQR